MESIHTVGLADFVEELWLTFGRNHVGMSNEPFCRWTRREKRLLRSAQLDIQDENNDHRDDEGVQNVSQK